MNRDLVFIALSLSIWGVGEGMFFFFQPLYLQQMGANPVMIGTIIGIIGIAMTVAHIPAGYLADRFGRRPLLLAAWFIGAIAAWIMALAHSLPVFVAGSALYGMTSFVAGPMNSYVTAARGKWSVGRAITLISATYNAGAILGPLLGGWVGYNLGLQRSFTFGAILFILSCGLILGIRSQPVERPHPDDVSPGMKGLLNPRYVQFLGVVFLATFSMYLPQPLSQNFLQNERGLNLEQIGSLLAARSAGVVLLNLTLGQLNARYGFLLAQVAMGLFTVFIWKGSGMPWYMAGYLLMGSYQTARSLAAAQGRALVKSTNMGIAYGMIETVSATVIILGPPLAGFLYSLKPVWIYGVGLVGIAGALLASFLFMPVKPHELI